ncbi:MAG: T9SS type A sorting domain-containing protein [Candidatus Marinimicrobia bacterium]|nr:T9SS type A sorting domain-containing protein [Candidatus Neomarinimicrobiota bacterium]
MTITADVEIDGIQISEDDQLGVFVNGECRGTAVPTYFPLTDSYTINLMTYGENGDELSFRVYQSETNTEIEVLDNLTFEINGIIGNDIDPILLRAVVIPDEYSLSQNYPNPFNPTTTINYAVETNGRLSLQIYNIAGKLVETLVNEQVEAGYHQITWNADNQPSGLYFVRMTAGEDVSTQKMLLLK